MTNQPANQRPNAFSLIEMMVAVTLLLVIIGALLAVFYQTQRAFRIGTTQVDVLEGGRAAMELMVPELSETTHSYRENQINIYAQTTFALLVQPFHNSAALRTNLIQDIYFLRQHNDEWIGTGYFVLPTSADSIGALYRFETNVFNVVANTQISNLFGAFQAELKNPINSHRVIDRVIHLKLSPYNSQGQYITNWVDPRSFSFTNCVDDLLPAYVDLELGILEPRAFEKYKALSDPAITSIDPQRPYRYLTNHIENVHIFRHRIPIASEPHASPAPLTIAQ